MRSGSGGPPPEDRGSRSPERTLRTTPQGPLFAPRRPARARPTPCTERAAASLVLPTVSESSPRRNAGVTTRPYAGRRMRGDELEREETKTMLSADDWRPRRWRVALIAHDAMKMSLLGFVRRYRAQFKDWELLATASTGEVIREATGLRVRTVLPGASGGDLQIGAEIAAGEVDALIFLRDPLTAHPHEPKITALLRVADV